VDGSSIYVAMGILGAVVMPHNIFLHSNVIHSRSWGSSVEEKKRLLTFEKIDTTVAMFMGWVVNSAMIIVAAAVFARHGITVDSIEQASETLRPLAGPLAGFVFALALVFAGVGSKITSSMAEVNVITGFLGKPEDPRTFLYKIAVFITAIPSFVIIFCGMDTFKIPIVAHVRALAQQNSAQVTLMHVIHAHTIDQDRVQRASAARVMDARLAEMRMEGVEARSIVSSGEPEAEILKEIEAGGYDLIAMATHGHTFIGDILFGSVSKSLKHKINIPLLLLKAGG